MKPLRFTFDPERAILALAFFADAEVPDLTKLKAAKLFYFADKDHLLRHGRPILGDTYYCLDSGPIPSGALNIMNEAVTATPEEAPSHPIQDFLKSYLDVILRHHPVFRARRKPELDAFSESEVESLRRTVESYGALTAGQLIELTHREATWQTPNEGREPGHRADIPYQLFFENAGADATTMKALVEAEQEEREFVQSL
jgi:uncharacterized phage-associated protein